MSASAVVMMIVYLGIVGGGLAYGVGLMATHPDETAGELGALEHEAKAAAREAGGIGAGMKHT
ncbi:methionine/alanine import family NSS transporter small subunit [Arcanobacterium phocae]|uniref:methionine/alanine import family NSS transporter small subunit n=1 Tax=Arcanobacterium phocae TaxID=131112 RepID=UPI001C0ECB12|nr:methionine/alanine import family NSS transporter small subunit [Arcanobacterium phocae]